jgi:hypothetical protein
MKWKEILFVVLMLGGLLAPAAITGQWWLFSVFMVFGIIFGLIEWLAVAKTKMSVSQHFWAYSKEHKVGAWCVLAGMLVAWLALLWHLAAKLI